MTEQEREDLQLALEYIKTDRADLAEWVIEELLKKGTKYND